VFWVLVKVEYLHLTSQVSKEQIRIYNDGIGTMGKLPCSGAERQIFNLSARGFDLPTSQLLAHTLTTRLPAAPSINQSIKCIYRQSAIQKLWFRVSLKVGESSPGSSKGTSELPE
jgi:hypothetical protein